MKLRLKLVSAFFTVALLLIVAGIWSIISYRELGVSVQEVLDENYRTIRATQKMAEALEREDSAVLLLMQGYWEDGRSQIVAADSVFITALQIAQGNITVPGEAELLNSLELHYEDYKNIWERPIVRTDRQGSLLWYRDTAHVAFKRVKGDIEQVTEINGNSMYETASNLESMAERAMMPGIIAIISAFFLTATFSYFISALVVSPIVRMTNSVRAFREGGDLTKLEIHTGDEIQDLAEEIRLVARRTTGKR